MKLLLKLASRFAGALFVTGAVVSTSSCTHLKEQTPENSEVAEAVTVATQRNGGSGVYFDTYLQPDKVRYDNFGKLWHYNVDGYVYAQPVTLDSVNIPNYGVMNLVFIATNKNKVYAFNADRPGWLVWQFPPTDGSIPLPPMDGTIDCPGLNGNGCKSYGKFVDHQISGIMGTPVISNNKIYFVTMVDPNVANRGEHPMEHRLWALDVVTGQPVVPQGQLISGSYRSNTLFQDIDFNSFYHLQRPGLLAQGGNIYVAFGSHADTAPYQGWIFSFNATTLAKNGTFCTSCPDISPSNPGHGGVGIWQAGAGLVGDGTSVYFTTGNSYTDTGQPVPQYSNSLIRLNGTPVSGLLGVAASFKAGDPSRTYGFKEDELANRDLDVGAGGPVLISTNRVLTGSKEGLLYIADRSTLALTQNPPARATANIYSDTSHNAITPPLARPGHPVVNQMPPVWEPPHIHGSPIYWSGHGLYVWGEKDYLRRYQFDATFSNITTSVSNSATADVSSAPPFPDGMPGGMLALASNPGAGTGVLFAAVRYQYVDTAPEIFGQGTLRAIDAAAPDMPELWSADVPFTAAKFTAATISSGRVYVPTFQNQVQVFGKIDRPASVVAPSANHLDLFTRGYDGVAYHKSYDGTAWQPAVSTMQSLGMNTLTTPVAVSTSSTYTDVFIRGTDGAIWHKVRSGTDWQFPAGSGTSLGGSIIGPLSATAWNTNSIQLFGEWASDHTVRQNNWNGSVWSGWQTLGAPTGGALASVKGVSWGGLRLDVFALSATTGEVFTKAYAGGATWVPSNTTWSSLGGSVHGLRGELSVTTWNNRIDVLARGADGDVYWKYWNGSAWSPSGTTWTVLGAPPDAGGRHGIADVPRSVVISGSNQIVLFVQGANGLVYTRPYTFATNSWGAWTSMPGEVLQTPIAVSSMSNRLDIFTRGTTDSAIYSRATSNLSTWFPAGGWSYLGGVVGF